MRTVIGISGFVAGQELEDLLAPTAFWLRDLSETQTTALAVAIHKCFDKWKAMQVDETGMVRIHIGMLSTGTLAKVNDVSAWDCAGPGVRNVVDLAFRLWLEGYPPFLDLLQEKGTARTFAMCAWISPVQGRVLAPSMIRVTGFLGRLLMQVATTAIAMKPTVLEMANQKERQNRVLPVARENAAKKKKELTEELDKKIRDTAFKYFQANPGASCKKAAKHVERQKFPDNEKPLALSTIERKIKGVKAEALRALNRFVP